MLGCARFTPLVRAGLTCGFVSSGPGDPDLSRDGNCPEFNNTGIARL